MLTAAQDLSQEANYFSPSDARLLQIGVWVLIVYLKRLIIIA